MRLLLIAVLLCALGIPLLLDNQVYATDNTTIDIGFSENITMGTITMSTGNITITDLEESLKESAESGAEIIADSLVEMLEKFFAFIVVAMIVLCAFATRSTFFQIIASPVVIVYGLVGLTVPSDQNSPLWVAGLVIAIFGTSMLFKVIYDALPARFKQRLNLFKR